MKQRQAQKMETKEKILSSAINLFSESGISNCTTARIAKEAGVSHGTIFAHFRTRDDLLVKLILDLFSKIVDKIKSRASRDLSLKEYFSLHLEGIKAHESFYTEIIREKHLLPDEAKSAILLAQSTTASTLVLAIERSISEGRCKALKPVFIVNSWMGLIHHYLLNRESFVKEGSLIEEKGTFIIDNFLKMIELQGARND